MVAPSTIQRTAHSQAGAVEHVGVNHGSADIGMSEQFLHGAYVGAVFEQVRGEPSGSAARQTAEGCPAGVMEPEAIESTSGAGCAG